MKSIARCTFLVLATGVLELAPLAAGHPPYDEPVRDLPEELRPTAMPSTRYASSGGSGSFTIPVIPDTQNYVRNCDPFRMSIYDLMMEWIVDNAAAMNVPYVHHVGDIQSQPWVICEWDACSATMAILEDASVSWGLSMGNHEGCFPWLELCPPSEPPGLENFVAHFPEHRWAGDPTFGRTRQGTMDDSYHLFTAGGVDFIVVNIGFWQPPRPEALAWTDAILKAYPDRIGIVGQHSILSGDGSWTAEGLVTIEALKHNRNLKLMLCGHRLDDFHSRRTVVVDGHRIQVVMVNYQMISDTGGDGFLHLAEFTRKARRAHFTTYSPWLDGYSSHAESEFVLNLGSIGDIDADGRTSTSDLLDLLSQWGPCPDLHDCLGDVDGSGTVDSVDLLLLLGDWSA